MIDKMSDKLAATIKPCKRCGLYPMLCQWNVYYHLICPVCWTGIKFCITEKEAIVEWNKHN